MAMMLAVLYNLVSIAMRCVYEQPHSVYLHVFLALDYTCDILYLCDMFYSSRIGKILFFSIVTELYNQVRLNVNCYSTTTDFDVFINEVNVILYESSGNNWEIPVLLGILPTL